MVTLGMDLGSFSLGKPREKLPKSIPLVTICLLIGIPLPILFPGGEYGMSIIIMQMRFSTLTLLSSHC